MTPQDRAWEMAALARQDGDLNDAHRWIEVALGRPIRKACIYCNGGMFIYPYRPIVPCVECHGTGIQP